MMSFLIYIIPLAVLAFVLMRRRGLPESKVKELIRNGAQIIDVRTAAEFRRGHAQGALNIPLDQLEARKHEVDPSRPVLLCCASGSRSGLAVSWLRGHGFSDVHNAGPWNTVA